MKLPPPGYPILIEDVSSKVAEVMEVAADTVVTGRFGRLIYGCDILLRTVPIIIVRASWLWLNDNIINQYMDLSVECARLNGNGSVYAMDTSFWICLRDLGWEEAKQIAGDVDILRFDTVLVPINNRNHWALATIRRKQREIKFYDSFGHNSDTNDDILNTLEEFVRNDCWDRHRIELDTTFWTKRTVKNIPRQGNYFDCGIFVCAYAESIARNQYDFKFLQKHMPYFRKKIAYEIATGRLLN